MTAPDFDCPFAPLHPGCRCCVLTRGGRAHYGRVMAIRAGNVAVILDSGAMCCVAVDWCVAWPIERGAR